MWTISVKSDSLITVMTENSKSLGKIVGEQPSVERATSSLKFGSMFSSASANMVNGQKFDVCFSATRAFTAIMVDKFYAALKSPFFVALKNFFGMSLYPFSAPFSIAFWISFSPFLSGIVDTLPATNRQVIVSG